MSAIERAMPEGFGRGPNQGEGLIGEVTEAVHRFLLDGWTYTDRPVPRIEEDLSFVPKDREEVVYVYMYRAAQNTELVNSKRFRPAKVSIRGGSTEQIYYERPPLYLNLHYLIGVHSKFRSDAERLLGWVLLRLHEATHLIYRPRKYILPDGSPVDSLGRPWTPDADGDDLIFEKVSLALVDDLTIGDAINFFTIHEAPYRPFLTYMARCAMEGPLISGPVTTIRSHGATPMETDRPAWERPGGRLGRMETRPTGRRNQLGPEGHDYRPMTDSHDSED